MSQSTKRKHVTKEVLDEFRLPQNNEKIVQIIAGRGNNLHEVYDPNCESVSDLSLNQELGANKYLVSMPTKFRKNVWIKRGDYVVVEPILEGDKVKAEIVQILYKEQIKYIKEQRLWPKEFSDDREKESKSFEQKIDSNKRADNNELESDEESDDESDIFQNTNRPKVDIIKESSDSSSSEDEQ